MNLRIAVLPVFVFLCTAALAQPAPQAPAPAPQAGPKSPVVQADGKVTFNLLAPNATAVTISGDYPIGRDLAMTKGADGVWSVTVGPLREDFYGYQYTVDGIPALDPKNIYVTRDGSRYLNWAVVPGPDSSNYEVNNVPHGEVRQLWYASPVLNLTREVTVYTPPGYATSQARYPVLYLQHGGGGDELAWTEMGRAPEIFDNLIAQGKMVPMIVVMGNGNPWQTATPNSLGVEANPMQPPSGGLTQPESISKMLTVYPDSLARDLVPFIDKNFRTKADRDDRAIAGLSMGGAQTIHATFTHLDLFSWTAFFSSAAALLPGVGKPIPQPADAASRRGPGLGQGIDPDKFVQVYPEVGPKLNSQLHLLYLAVGKSDGLLESHLELEQILADHQVKYVTYNLPGFGHEWAFWRLALEDYSQRLFKTAQ